MLSAWTALWQVDDGQWTSPLNLSAANPAHHMIATLCLVRQLHALPASGRTPEHGYFRVPAARLMGMSTKVFDECQKEASLEPQASAYQQQQRRQALKRC